MEPSKSFDLWLLLAGIPCAAWMVIQILNTIRRGEIRRRPPRPNFTRQDNPGLFWGFIAYVTLATCGIVGGLVVAAFEYFGQ
jgi:hypothetical protein